MPFEFEQQAAQQETPIVNGTFPQVDAATGNTIRRFRRPEWKEGDYLERFSRQWTVVSDGTRTSYIATTADLLATDWQETA